MVDADIRSYFDQIPQAPLMGLVERRISDPRMLKLIRAWLKAGVMDDGQYTEPDGLGSPQGPVISPLLANIYLHVRVKSGVRSPNAHNIRKSYRICRDVW